jgi:hypothetical protein
MKTTLSDAGAVQRRTTHQLASDPTPISATFLIANERLDLDLTHRKESPLKISNRKCMAISQFASLITHLLAVTGHPSLTTAVACPLPLAFRPVRRATSHSSLIIGFLIETPRLEFAASSRKQTLDHISNRDKTRCLRPPRRAGCLRRQWRTL